MSTSTSTKEPLGLRNPIHNPFPASLSSECIKAAKIIDSFINPLIVGNGGIPRKILGSAKVLIICTVFRAGFLGTGRFGSGIMVSRLPDGSWSAPSAVALGGFGFGGLVGAELTDFVFVMSTDEAVARVMHSPSVSLSLNVSLALGLGRSAESGAMAGMRGMSGFYSYSKTRGLYAGISAEAAIICENPTANKKIYERKLKARQLVGGEIPFPREAELLMRVLNSDQMRSQGSSTGSEGTNRHASRIPDEFYQGPGPFAGSDSNRPTSNASTSPYPEARELPTQAPRELPTETPRELPTSYTARELPAESSRELPTEANQVYELGPSRSIESGNAPASPRNNV